MTAHFSKTAVATLQPKDPYDDRPGPWFSQTDLKLLSSLPAGTKLYTKEALNSLSAAAPEMLEALDRIFSYVSYVNIHGVGDQPESNGLPQPMRVPPDEFARIFQEIGKLASSALSKAEGLP